MPDISDERARSRLLERPASERYSDEAFKKYYAEKIQPLWSTFEKERRQAAATVSRRTPFAITYWSAIMVFVLIAIMGWHWPTGRVLGLGALAAFVVYAWVSADQRQYIEDIKTQIFPIIFSFFGETFKYVQPRKNPVHIDQIKKLGVFENIHSHQVGDYVSGTYKGVELRLTELQLWKKVEKSRTQIFKGLLVVLKFGKAFRGTTIVKSDQGRLGNLVARNNTGLVRVRLEDPLFEQRFEVFGSDQIEARVILTPGFMERIKEIERRHQGVQFSFIKKEVAIFLSSNQDFFGVNTDLDRMFSLADDIAGIRHEIGMLFDLIETLSPQRA